MNKILREEMEYLITCDDKAITPDVKDDVFLTLQYIDELETKINKAIEYIELSGEFEVEVFDENTLGCLGTELGKQGEYLLKILRGEDGENDI